MKKIFALTLIAATVVCVACAKHKPEHEWNEFTYAVSEGDTLWSIAEEYCPEDMDYCEYIYEIKELNKMEKSNISAGQIITLLTDETSLVDICDVVDIQENDGLYTITLDDEWFKGELR